MNDPIHHPPYEVLPPEGQNASPRRGRRRKRSATSNRLARFALAALGGSLIVAAFTYVAGPPASIPVPANGVHPATAAYRVVATVLPSEALRPVVYPYSVIPGGARSRTELNDAAERDRVVALHYAAFDTSRVQPVRVAAPRRVHVSYRVGDRIYWTKRTVALHPGETLLTDGSHEVRARCGNRIADEVIGETSTLEPSEVVLDTPVLQAAEPPAPGLQPLQVYNLFAANGVMPPVLDGGLPIETPGGGAGGIGGYGPPTPGAYGGVPTPGTSVTPREGGGPPDTSTGPPTDNPPPDEPPGPPPPDPPGPPPIVTPHERPIVTPHTFDPPDLPPAQVPEPGTVLLVAAGCALFAARRLSSRS